MSEKALMIIVDSTGDLQEVHVAELDDGTFAYLVDDASYWQLNKNAGTFNENDVDAGVLTPRDGSPIAGAAGARWFKREDNRGVGTSLVTVDATPGVMTIPLPDNSITLLRVAAIARDPADGESAAYTLDVAAKRHAGGAAALVGAAAAILTAEDDAGWSFAAAVAGNNLTLTATGAIGDTITWDISAQVKQIIVTT